MINVSAIAVLPMGYLAHMGTDAEDGPAPIFYYGIGVVLVLVLIIVLMTRPSTRTWIWERGG